ncbi:MULTISPECIES: tyrosine-type recombinase/integrase [Chryseobacterium]|uniref:Integrase n=1 Tax=Chryseobacterium geocarposphaerae TaxID=1416776 RepID=A0ABU1LGQ9_9FLAO|nr:MULTISPECIES: tyrosine-type recombinase/integrase [Chryseobacterium]MDR6405874.1 integrase [Chryseobacterium geocarposphaerae]MDR6698962.1 integrase [Chryseobacterium ginsenosidimutans]
MATLKFLLHSKKSNASIYCYLSEGRGKFYQRKTRETINPENWNPKKGQPKNITSGTEKTLKENETLKQRLSEIESFILEQYRNRTETEIINGEWLEEIITAYYSGGRKLQQLDYLDNYLEYYKTEVLPFRKHRGKRITEATKKKQKTIINKIQEFTKSLNKRLKVSDYDVSVSNKFEQFLENQGIAKGTIGRYIKYPKTIISHAKTLNIEINNNLSEIKGYTTETPTIFITEAELQEIQKLTFLKPELETTKDWLIIGFYTGQRASDLFKMNTKMFLSIDNEVFINLNQQKTKNGVLIPLHNEVKKVLDKRNGNFPPTFSDNIESAKTIFNKHLRVVAKQANINRLEFGKKWDDETKRNIYGKYPLCEIISSHVCRRSFATHNYIKVPTPIIMAITGHKTEKEFLNYIGRDFNDLSKEMLSYWKQLDKDKGDDSQIKNAN